MNFTILRFESLGSTNTEAISQAKLGADEGVCVIARQQTAGRGRHGRTWVSEKDAGLYLSLVLRPKFDMGFLPLITLMTGVAVFDTLQHHGLNPDIKWVNDLHVNDKKIAGILAETADTPQGLAVIVGIGINLRSSRLPNELAETATSIESEIHQIVNAEDIANTLSQFLNHYYALFDNSDGPQQIIREWRRRSSYFEGKSVRIIMGNEIVIGITDGLEDNGALRVRTADGTIAIIQSGDCEKLRTIYP